jgi:thiol-disulfide isomerase/thioredoxin
VLELLFAKIIFSQPVAKETFDIPKQYEGKFKDDEKRYFLFTRAAEASAGSAFNLWNSSVKDNWKGYNIDSLHAVYDSLSNVDFLRKIEFFKENHDSYASLYYFDLRLANRYRLKPDSLLSVYFLLSKSLQSTPLGKNVLELLKRRQSLLVGNKMPDFSFITNTGDKHNLYTPGNKKHVLICFWASWCSPCIKSIPLLKSIHNKYENKDLQIISVSIDNIRANWLTAIEKYSMPWLQTCDLPDHIKGEKIRKMYEVFFIPQYFLLDPQGKLIYHNLQLKDDDNYSLLQQVLAKELK